jgi:hypothetical protein
MNISVYKIERIFIILIYLHVYYMFLPFCFNFDRISYCPKSVGKYSIHVLDSEQNTAGKPIKVDVFDPNMIKLSKIGDAVLGQDNRIRVDTGNIFKP